MVKPRKGGALGRRLLTVSIYALSWLLLTISIPAWLILGLLVGALRRRHFIILRLLVFAWFYFGFELMALSLIVGVFVIRRDSASRFDLLYRLQAWWASLNLRAAQRLLQLSIEVEGAERALPGPAIILVRHASILDTLLPCTYVQRPFRFRLRYVLKQELLFDPCIDIVGNLLPNYFVDRRGNRQRELEGLRSLVHDLGSDGILIFPEGTRFSTEKRRKSLERLNAEGSKWAESAQALTHVLPPKPGGVLALLDALPNVDCVLLAHTGLEAFAKIKDLLSGDVVGSTVRIMLWRVDAKDIPRTDDARLEWLFAEWGRVNAFVRNPTEII
jgi:1-acyl-sn-glycerol-3-phosphate acyltransferase